MFLPDEEPDNEAEYYQMLREEETELAGYPRQLADAEAKQPHHNAAVLGGRVMAVAAALGMPKIYWATAERFWAIRAARGGILGGWRNLTVFSEMGSGRPHELHCILETPCFRRLYLPLHKPP